MGEVGEAEVVVAGVVAKALEGLIHVEVSGFADLAFGLFDDDPAG